MDHSDALQTDLTCSRCGKAFVVDVWLIVDADERPDLLDAILLGTIHEITCPHCGESHGHADAPLLIYQPTEQDTLIFSPAQQTSQDEDKDQAANLLRRLHERLEVERPEPNGEFVTVPRQLLPAALEKGAEVVKQRLADEGIRVLVESLGLSQETLSELRESVTAVNLEVGPPEGARDSSSLEVTGKTHVVERRRPARSGTRSKQAGRKPRRRLSQREEPERKSEPDENLVQALTHYVEAKNWTERFNDIMLHPELLSDEVDSYLTFVSDAARARGEEDVADSFDSDRAFLRRCRMVGVYLAFHEQSSYSSILEEQADLAPIVAEIVQLNRLNDMPRRIQLCMQALALVNPVQSPEIWAVLQGELGDSLLGNPFGNSGDLVEQAIEAYEKALDVLVRPSDARRSILLTSLAIAYRRRERGDLTENVERAIETCRRAIELLSRETTPFEWARAMHTLGSLYTQRALGNEADNIERAIEAIENALQVVSPGTTPGEWAIATGNLANAYRDRIHGDRAENLERALELSQQTLRVYSWRTKPYEWAGAARNLATIYDSRILGDRTENLKQATEICRKTLKVLTREATPLAWAKTMALLAKTYELRSADHLTDDMDRAIRAYEQALEVAQPDVLPDLCRIASRALGDLQFRANRWREAADSYQLASRATENLRRSSLLLSSKAAETAKSGNIYRLRAYALARLGNPEEAVVTIENGRAVGLNETLARDRAELEEVRMIDPEALDKYQVAAARLHKLEDLERTHDLAAHGLVVPLAREALREQAESAKKDLDSAIARIQQIAGYENFLGQTNIYGIRMAVQAGSPIVYLVTTLAGSLAILVYEDIPVGEVVVEAIWSDEFLSENLAAILVKRAGDDVIGGYAVGQLYSSSLLQASLAEVLPILGKQFIGPLAARLHELEERNVVLIPTGSLASLPFHAATYDFGGRRVCLLDEFNVSYAPSARVLTAARLALAARREHQLVLAGVGNPLPNPKPLPFACSELEEISMFFQEDVHLLFEEAATKDALLEAVRRATHVHLACHGLFDTEQPLRSHLQLSRGQILTLPEIMSGEYFQDARLAVLSACQTAIPDLANLPDEVVGMQTGFLQAGVPGVVGTLWSVDDLSTALLNTKFYELHLRGDSATGEGPLSPVRALRHAQLWLRNVTGDELVEYFQRRRASQETVRPSGERLSLTLANAIVIRFALDEPDTHPFNSPFYWAPFIYMGV